MHIGFGLYGLGGLHCIITIAAAGNIPSNESIPMNVAAGSQGDMFFLGEYMLDIGI